MGGPALSSEGPGGDGAAGGAALSPGRVAAYIGGGPPTVPDLDVVMRQLAPSAACLLATLAQAGAQPLPVTATTYVERSLNRAGTLVIEHPPVAVDPAGRVRGSRAAVAGFCRDGGLVRRRDELGRPVIVRQREVCDSVAPRTLMPGAVDPRPAWPAEPAYRAVLRSKG